MVIKNVNVKIMGTKRRLRDSQKSEASIGENITQILHSISKLHDSMQSIAYERNTTKEKLELEKRGCQLLSEMQDVLSEVRDILAANMRDSSKKQHQQLQENEVAYRILLGDIIVEKRKQIENLEEELRQKNSDLQSAQHEARSLHEKLLQARAELAMKSEEVKQLQKENEELACSYNIEKEQVSKLVHIMCTVALTAYQKVCTYASD